jgi:hypothetical protein
MINNTKFEDIFKYLILTTFVINCKYSDNYSSILTNKILTKILKTNKKISKEIISYVNKKYFFYGNFQYYINSHDFEHILYIEKNQLHISINGTDTSLIKRFLNDITYFLNLHEKEIEPDIIIHAGYYDSINKNNMMSTIFECIKKNKFDSIHICGHSAGGTLASYIAYLINKEYPDMKINLCVFGSPKPGNQKFIDYIQNSTNIELSCIINSNDIIPLLPPIQNYNNYNFITITATSQIVHKDILLSNNYNILDHTHTNYIDNLYKIIKN